MAQAWQRMSLPEEVSELLQAAPSVTFAGSSRELCDLAVRDADESGVHTVAYDVPGRGPVEEAKVCRVRNGIAANYLESYMRRRDPQCTVIGDEKQTDKKRFADRFGFPFADMRQQTFDWMRQQHLAAFAFYAGRPTRGMPGMAICPANAGFFALGLSMLQGVIPAEQIDEDFQPEAFIFVAPPFRHTHFDGHQVVVHNRHEPAHELFSYNLYPGPSAKKGVYGMLINLGEEEGWITAHCSTVEVVTPYDNHVVMMHEGASGGGKSEMLEHIHREPDGRLLLGENTQNAEKRHITLARACKLHPVTDDMALCLGYYSGRQRKLRLRDAEDAWFVRVNHIEHYGTDPHLEAVTVHPDAPLLFLNIDAVPRSTALIWEHVQDAPGEPCPNPRVILPREQVPGTVDDEVVVDIRSFGIRTPPCTAEHPTYGIVGLFHLLPPALAWLWRLTAPRGHGNPSIVTEGAKMTSEGVGSYWPFALGRRVDQANLIYDQIMRTTDTLFVLCPNQHIGAWKVGFMPQWLTREYLARRGHGRFRPDQLRQARCPLLGHTLEELSIEGTAISHWFLNTEMQPEVGEAGYDAGASMLYDFFREQLAKFLDNDLHPQARRIIDACLDGASVEDYQQLSEPIED
ncbi:MAG: DUF4914 family protein [Planctomycetes bacterium]|nr:DUF4914 family protein [Planctomycetota bacterium]